MSKIPLYKRTEKYAVILCKNKYEKKELIFIKMCDILIVRGEGIGK